MHLDDLWALGASASREELRGRLLRVMEGLAFERMGAHVFIDGRSRHRAHDFVDNAPPGYDEVCLSSPGIRCPVMQHLKRSHVPIIYGQATYVEADAATLWEEQAPYDYAAGIACALHLPEGRHLVFGFDRDQPVPSDSNERLRLMGALQAVLSHCVAPAFRHLAGAPPGIADPPRLTPRERQVLQWTALGKSASMVAEITNLSFSTVNFHLRNASHKLGCNNKHVAACRAQALGLIST